MMDLGKVEKMKLKAFSDNTFRTQVGEEFTMMINPETISRKFAIEYQQENATTTTTQPFWGIKPEEFKIDILFDSTGVMQDPSLFSGAVVNPLSSSSVAKDLTEKIKKFVNFCINMQSETHRPNFIQVEWGTLLFKGETVSLDLDYKLFSKKGKPIRVVAHLSLKSALDPLLEYRIADLQSPDITHQKTVKAGDRFWLTAHKTYDTPEFYIDVAKANQLLSFRRVPVGTILNLPPLKNK